MFRTKLLGLIAAAPLLLAATPAQAQTAGAPGCQFQGGFGIVAGLIPDVVGNCSADARPANDQGDTMQETTNGLLTWTRATNVVEFTTGQKTWVYSGYGMVLRDGGTTYPWEGPTEMVAGVAINKDGHMIDPATGAVLPTDAHVKPA